MKFAMVESLSITSVSIQSVNVIWYYFNWFQLTLRKLNEKTEGQSKRECTVYLYHSLN